MKDIILIIGFWIFMIIAIISFIFMMIDYTKACNPKIKIYELYNEQEKEQNQKINYLSKYSGNWLITKKLLEYSDKHNIDYKLVFALVKKESSFNYKAKNIKNKNGSKDYGLFQLNSHVYKNYTEKELLDLDINIDLGIKHLKYAYELSDNNIKNTVIIYNAGYGSFLKQVIPIISKKHAENIIKEINIIGSNI